MSYPKFKEKIELMIKRYVATELAPAVQEQQPEKGYYIATPAVDAPEDIVEKYGFKFRICAHCEKEVAIDPKMLKFADDASEIICTNCLPEEVGANMEDIVKIIIGRLEN